jgi:prepilin-type N-terminal cleavage/methylation domain-containing protein/prepilin-type processing-associated H-X9-DG protein
MLSCHSIPPAFSQGDLVIPRSRKAFTLIELLVVIAIIAILIALLIPAVQRVRDSASRAQCVNNLKQIGLACHHYHDTYSAFPPGYIADDPFPGTSPGWGWPAFLLPYIEQQNLFNQVNFNNPLESQPVIQNIIATYLCPADSPPEIPFEITDATFSTLCMAAPSSYAATVGQDADDVADPTGSGVFFRNSKIRLTDITDGTSSTTLIGDRAWSNTKGIWAGAPNGAITRSGPGNSWLNATNAAQALVLVHNNWINITNDSDGGLDDFSSNHYGGVNLVFADGSVRFIASIVNDGPIHRSFWAMGTRAGGELIDGVE